MSLYEEGSVRFNRDGRHAYVKVVDVEKRSSLIPWQGYGRRGSRALYESYETRRRMVEHKLKKTPPETGSLMQLIGRRDGLSVQGDLYAVRRLLGCCSLLPRADCRVLTASGTKAPKYATTRISLLVHT